MTKYNKNKPLFLRTNGGEFRTGEILWMGGDKHVIVIDDSPRNTLWQKFKRWLGFRVFNPEGHIKVKNYEERA